MPDSCGLAVLGAGPAGLAAAARAAELGLDAVLVSGSGHDPGLRGIRIRSGHGRLAGPGRVAVEHKGRTREFGAGRVILAMGTVPVVPPGVPAGCERIVCDLPAEPGKRGSWIVLGAGASGVAAACVLREAGCEVTLVERTDGIMPGIDAEIAGFVAEVLRNRGVRILAGHRAVAAAADRAGVRCTLRRTVDRVPVEVKADSLLVAAGRRPRTRGIGLAAANVLTDRKGFVLTDGFMATTRPGLYAIGGIVPTGGSADTAEREARTAVDHAAGRTVAPLRYDRIPRHLDLIPPVSGMGLTEGEARDTGHVVGVVRFRFGAGSCSGSGPEASGFGKIVADRETGTILGFHLAGLDARPRVVGAAAAWTGKAGIPGVIRSLADDHEVVSAALDAVLRGEEG